MNSIASISEHLVGKKRDALFLMAQGMSCPQICDRTGIALQSLYNWRSGDPEFKAELERLRRLLYEEGVGALRGLVQEATATLHSVMTNKAARDADCITAARTVLQFAMSHPADRATDRDPLDDEFRGIAEELTTLVRAVDGG